MFSKQFLLRIHVYTRTYKHTHTLKPEVRVFTTSRFKMCACSVTIMIARIQTPMAAVIIDVMDDEDELILQCDDSYRFSS